MTAQRLIHPYLDLFLNQKEQVLIYSGDVDYICNWLGNKKWVKALEWEGQEQFNQADDKPWNLSTGKNQKVIINSKLKKYFTYF